LAIDWVGADGAVDLPIDPADQAQALILLLDHLGIARVAAYIGASYGAMVGMHFAAWHPRRLDALLAISAAGSSHPYASACRALQRRAVSFGEKAGDPASGVELARELAILTYRTPEEFAERFAERPSIVNGGLRVASEDYLDAHGERFGRCMSSTAYRRLSESIDLHAIDGVQLRLPVTLVAVAGDALVPADDCRALADSIPHARFHQLESRYGHDAFLKEERQIGRIITEFLNSLEQQS
jgi:homoserine O-acetyltransferase